MHTYQKDHILVAHSQKDLLASVERLTSNHDLSKLSDLWASFIYFLSHPEQSHEIDKTTILDHVVECFGLLGDLDRLRDSYEFLKKITGDE